LLVAVASGKVSVWTPTFVSRLGKFVCLSVAEGLIKVAMFNFSRFEQG
jgi:hypothetical protein